MLLKRLEMTGFKSFADKTEITFEPGITALVGPNGCGKSNVVDAIKWILGEQSVKSLRGSEMADVIFNGNANRKSHGFAEATLVFDNADRQLPLDLDEVAITRRIYRSGEGVYFINKQNCRLKDIKNLFLDTGIGMQCYSVIEQGKIDQILQTGTAERRRVFDEAAGISKYKARRKEAQAKLDRVEQNLLRLNDIVEEVEKQLRSVKYQAAKARRYREYTVEYRKLRVSYSLNDYDDLSRRCAEVSQKLGALGDSRIERATARERIDARRSECEVHLVELEKTMERAQARLSEVNQAFLAAEDAIRFNRSRIEELSELRQRYQRQLEILESRAAEMRRDLDARREELATVDRQVGEVRQMVEERARRLEGMTFEERELGDSLEQKKGEVVDLRQRVSRLENELGVAQSERRALEVRRQKLSGRLNEVTSELNENERAIHQADEDVAAIDRIIEGLAAQSRQKQDQQRSLAERLSALRDEIAAIRQRQSSRQSRLDVLRDLDEKQEGVEQGVREVLRKLREVGASESGLHGMLAETLTVEPKYARAVEAALGHRAQTLLVEHLDHAKRGLDVVNASGKGRASFLPLTHCGVSTNGQPAPEGAIGYLRDFVACDDRHAPVVECLMGNVLLVEGMENVDRLMASGLNGHALVTLAGEMVEPSGIITGGQGFSGGGIITRQTERRALEEELRAIGAELASRESELLDGHRANQAIGAEIDRLVDLAEREKSTRIQRLASLERLREKLSMLSEERTVVLSELDEIVGESAELDRRETDVRARLDEIRREDDELESRIEALTLSHQEIVDRRSELQNELTDLKVSSAQHRQRQEGLRLAIESLESNLRIRDEETEQLGRDIEDSKRKQAEAEQDIVRRQAELEDLRHRQEERREEVVNLTNTREELRDEMATLERETRQALEALSGIDGSMQELRLEEQEMKLKMQGLVERVREDYELDLVEMHATWQREEMNWEEVAERIEDLKRKIQNMGSVNLEAIENEEALVKRTEFLTVQRADLADAKRKLEDIIHRLNEKSRQMFEESFKVIRENFQEMFRKLFAGGKADLFLENEQDVLESGIEIIARPPGKEPRALTLLSGGEKVMTAVSLLFAIFKSRPSPFCVLDEVDAALDEANIGRFANILQEFLAHSQFIIITHSKRTMAYADVIYGITMPEQGVSTKVAVKFEEYEQQVA